MTDKKKKKEWGKATIRKWKQNQENKNNKEWVRSEGSGIENWEEEMIKYRKVKFRWERDRKMRKVSHRMNAKRERVMPSKKIGKIEE